MTNIVLTEDQFNQLINNKVVKKITINELNKTRNTAIDIETFIENFEFQNVTTIINSDVIEFLVNSIIYNIEKLEDDDIPIICSNAQTKQFFYKTQGKWIKETDFMNKLYFKVYNNAIGQVIGNFRSICDDPINAEKQRIVCKLCDCDNYPLHRIVEKSLLKLGRHLKSKI
jgi:hypothetical protein